jgi:toxin ParE1/3/4
MSLVLTLRSFPVGNYVIFYREVSEGIEIIRVLHGARDIEGIISSSE